MIPTLRHLTLAALAAATLAAGPASLPAQEAEPQPEAEETPPPEEQAGFLAGLIQDALGGEGRTVRVEGLQGALSSEASIARIEIADDAGTWLVVENVTLDWRRVALLRRRLEVEALTIGAIRLARPPNPPPRQAPSLQAEAEPEPFSLPSLPVAVQVDRLAVDRLELGEPVLGEVVAMAIAGQARLAGGEGSVDLDVDRLDRQGRFDLEAGFENDSRRLYVDLDVAEPEGGLIAGLANIPGEPPLTLTVQGDAPISDFTADLALATRGEERLAGTVSLAEEPGQGSGPVRVVTADLAGDVAPLFLPEYQDFFGRRIALQLRARQDPDAGLAVEQLDLTSRALSLSGSLAVGPDGWPRRIDVDGAIGTDIGLPVVLPLSGPPVLVDGVRLAVDYDAAAGDRLLAEIAADGILRADGLLIDALELTADGTLSQGEDAAPGRVTADVTSTIEGFSTTDPALWDAVGDRIQAVARVDWRQNEAIEATGIDLRSGDLAVTGQAAATGLGERVITATADIAAEAGDLARFAALAGQDLTGALNADIQGEYTLNSGAFAVDLTGTGQDLGIGRPDADRLLGGRSEIRLSAARDADGIEVDELAVDSAEAELAGALSIAPDGWPRRIDVAGRIGEAGGVPVALPVPGPAVTLQQATLRLDYDQAQGNDFLASFDASDLVQTDGPRLGNARLDATGQLIRGEGMSVERLIADLVVAVTGLDADDPGLARALGEAARVQADMDWDLDGALRLSDLSVTSGAASLTGSATAEGLTGGELRVSGDVAAATGPLERFAAVAGRDLAGSLRLDAAGDYAADRMAFDVDLDARGEGLVIGQDAVDGLLGGQSRVLLDASGSRRDLDLRTFEVETPELSVSAGGGMGDEEGRFTLTGRLRDVAVLAPDFPGAATVDAVATRQGEVWSVDGDMQGPGGTTAQVEGVALRPDGTVDLSAVGQLPLALANRLLAPRSIQGTANFDLAVQGEPGLEALSGTVSTSGARFAIPAQQLALEGMDVTATLNGARMSLDAGAALSSGGRVTASGPITLTPPFDADLTARLIDAVLVDPNLYRINLGGEIGMEGPLTGGAAISGLIEIDRAELQVPVGGAGTGTLIDITHVGEPAASRTTRTRARLLDPETEAQGGGGPAYPLDITILAPNEIFLRGRGLDVELGGEIQIGGTTQNVVPQGVLSLRRGRFDILRQRLNFDEATITLQGDLQPDLNLVASSGAGDVTAVITISGTPRNPEIELSSQPELPEDEVLAQLFFSKPVSELTPLELAQLAAAFQQLRGGGPGFLGRLRAGLGVDDLNVGTSEDGEASVTAGRYLTERVYSDVTFEADGTSEVQLNYEITPSFSVRGSFDNQGDTGVGFVFERDY